MKKTNTTMDTLNESRVFKNDHGTVAEGTKVSFIVENQDQWSGDLKGVLIFEDEEFKVKTENSGTLTINHGYDIYYNTIKAA